MHLKIKMTNVMCVIRWDYNIIVLQNMNVTKYVCSYILAHAWHAICFLQVFTANQTLKHNMLFHTGEKPHKCLHCQKVREVYWLINYFSNFIECNLFQGFRLKAKLAILVSKKWHTPTGPDWEPPNPRVRREN